MPATNEQLDAIWEAICREMDKRGTQPYHGRPYREHCRGVASVALAACAPVLLAPVTADEQLQFQAGCGQYAAPKLLAARLANFKPTPVSAEASVESILYRSTPLSSADIPEVAAKIISAVDSARKAGR